MKKIFLLIAVSSFLLLLNVGASAQSFTAQYAKKFVLGDGSLPPRTLTLTSPSTITTSYSLTYPAAVGASGQVLVTTDAVGTFGWATLTGTNSGDVTLAGTGTYLSLGAGQVITQNPIDLTSANVTNTLPIARGGTNSGTALGGVARPVVTTATAIVENNATISNNTIAKWSGSNFANSSITDDGTNVSTSENLLLSTSGAQLSFKGTSTGVSTFQAGAQVANTYNYTLPITTPTANQVLTATAISGATPFAVTLGWTTPSGGSGLSGLTTNGAMYASSATTAASTGAMTNGQILMGSTGVAPVANTITAGTGISVTNGAGTITIALASGAAGSFTTLTSTGNSTLGTSSSALANSFGTGANALNVLNTIGSTGAGSVTTINGGVTLATLTAQPGVVHNSALGVLSSSAVVLTTEVSGILPIANGGTNNSAFNTNGAVYYDGTKIASTASLTNGQILMGSTGVAPVANTITAGSGITITNGAGTISVASSNPVLFARKSTSTTLNASSVSLQSDGELLVSSLPVGTYEFSGVIAYTGSTSASNLKLGIAYSGTVTSIRWSADQGGTAIAPSSVAAVATTGSTGTAGTDILSTFTADATPTNAMTVFISGVIIVSTSGNFQMLESQATSQAATTTILSGSHIKLTRVQ